MRRIALTVTALVFGLATGCTDHDAPSSGTSGPPGPIGAARSPQGQATHQASLPARVAWYRGAPDGAEPAREDGTVTPVAASWLVDGSQVQVTVWGSGSCPAVGSHASVANDGTSVALTLRSYTRPCTSDVQPATSIVTLPGGAHVAEQVRVVVTGPAEREWSIALDRPRSAQGPGHGTSLSDSEVAEALAVAQREIADKEATVSNVSAIARSGRIENSNIGHPCTSGRLLQIKLLGKFPHIVTTGHPVKAVDTQPDFTVRAVIITADAETGHACLIRVQTAENGDVRPIPGATILYVQ